MLTVITVMNFERYVICIVHSIIRCSPSLSCFHDIFFTFFFYEFWNFTTFLKKIREINLLSLTWFLGSVTYTGAGWILSGPTLESIFCRVISHKWKSHMILFAKKKWRYKFSWIVSLAPLFCSCFAILIKQLQAMTWRPSFWPCKKVLLSPSEWHWKKKSSITQNVCKSIKISL